MRNSPLRLLSCLLALALVGAMSSATFGQSFSIGRLNLPIYAADGTLEKRLEAESLSGPLEKAIMVGGRVTLYEAGQKTAELTFTEATYHQTDGVVEGAGALRLTTDAGKLSGTGFRYALASGELRLRREVVGESRGVRVTGREADAVVRRDSATGLWVLGDAEIRGEVTVEGIASEKFPFDRAQTARATYVAATGTVAFSSPVRVWKNDQEGRLDGDKVELTLPHPITLSKP